MPCCEGELVASLLFITLSMSSLYWLSCLGRLFWIGRVVERLGPSLEGSVEREGRVENKSKKDEKWDEESKR